MYTHKYTPTLTNKMPRNTLEEAVRFKVLDKKKAYTPTPPQKTVSNAFLL